MNEITTQELMLHVERIVRPIGATQGRKLRMRTELLAHLSAAFEEERLRFPGDEGAAFEQAKLRLGEPAELTRQMQQTVPSLERVLLGRLAVPLRLEHMEQRMAQVPGQRGAMTMGHKVLLSSIALSLCVPLLMNLHNVVTTVGTPHTPNMAFTVGVLAGWPLLLAAFYRFVFEAANSDSRWDWAGTMKRGAAVLVLQLALASLATLACVNRAATPREVVVNLTSTVGLLALSLLAARYVGVVRRPYDEWLSLNIAE